MKQSKGKSALFAALALVFALSASCASQPANAGSNAPSGGAADSAYKIEYSKQFTIDYRDNGVRITTDAQGRKLALVPEGASVPEDAAGITQVKIPLKKGVYLSTTFIGFLGAIGSDSVYDSIIGVSTPKSDWTLKPVLDRFDSGQIKYIAQATSGAADIEGIIALQPDLVFVIGGMSSSLEIAQKLEEAGIASFISSEWLEIGEAPYIEWVKLFGAFLGMDKEADLAFKNTMASLGTLESKAKAASEAGSKPIVAYCSYRDGKISTPSSTSTIKDVVERAGAEYYLKGVPGEGQLSLTMEEWLNQAKDADIIIYSSQAAYGVADKAALIAQNALFGELKAFKGDNIYIYSKGYFMNAEKVDIKFSELVNIFHPELGIGTDNLFYEKI